MKAFVLHLSDLHFVKSCGDSEDHIANIITAIKNKLLGINNVIVIVSGDIAYSGKNLEYQYAMSFFDTLKRELLGIDSIRNVDFYIVPGNHDINYSIGSPLKSVDFQTIEKNNRKR